MSMKRVSPAVLAAILAAIVIAAVGLRTGPSKLWQEREVLRQVYTPKFDPIPEMLSARDLIVGLRDNLRSDRGQSFLRSWVPNQGGALWLSLLVMLAIGFNFKRPGDPRNIALVAMQALGFLFFDILRFLDILHEPYAVTLMDWVFCGIVFVNVLLMGLAVWRVVHPLTAAWRPSLPVPALVSAAVLLIAVDLFAAAVRPPDDAGFFVNLGGQRLRERGLLPYGDPILTGTPAAGYGPLLYAAHVPFQLVFDPAPANAVSSPNPPLGADSTYVLPPSAATKLCTIAFHLLGLVALFRIGRAHAGPEVGWALVALYAGSACVLGVGGEAYFIGGMTFVSHIAPAAVTLTAFAAIDRPAAAAVLLTTAAGVGFYPAFLAPTWLGFYWDRPAARRRFLTMLAISGAILAVAVLLLSRPAAGRGLVGTILWDTFGHHTDPEGYGFSPFSFWGQRGGIRGWLMAPLVGTSGLTTPAFLAFVTFACGSFALARRRAAPALALVTAAVIIGANLLKIHPTGTYVAWFYPFLLIGFLTAGSGSAADPEAVRRKSAKDRSR
jgi:hypothetical protein